MSFARRTLAPLQALLAFTVLFQSMDARASAICSNLLIDSKAGKIILREYAKELKRAIEPQLKRLNWRQDGSLKVLVKNYPTVKDRVAPHYRIKIKLIGGAILSNKTARSPLFLTSNPKPEQNACELVLQALDSEDLVNQDGYPTSVHLPKLKVRTLVHFKR